VGVDLKLLTRTSTDATKEAAVLDLLSPHFNDIVDFIRLKLMSK